MASSSNTTLYFVSPSTSISTTEDPITTTPSILSWKAFVRTSKYSSETGSDKTIDVSRVTFGIGGGVSELLSLADSEVEVEADVDVEKLSELDSEFEGAGLKESSKVTVLTSSFVPTYDDEKQLNPSWTWYSDTCDNADGSAGGDNESSQGTIKIPNLTTGSKIVYLQAIPCDSSLSIKNEMGNVQITSWWRNTTEFFLITTFTILLYAILAVIGLIGALRYQALEKDNSPRLVGNWIAFAFGIFVPLFQAVPIVNGFTAK